MRWPLLRMLAAVAAASGVVAGFVVNVDRAVRLHEDLGVVLANYFSLFTIVSASIAVVVLVLAAVRARRSVGGSADGGGGVGDGGDGRPHEEPLAATIGLTVVTGAFLLLGGVFNVLLRGHPPQLAIPDPPFIGFLDSWATEVLHVVVPVYMLVDLLVGPPRRRVPWWALGLMVAYPLAWTGYTMARGELVANPDGSAPFWYPYDFLDPHGDGGWASALTYIGVLLAGFVVLGALVILVSRFRTGRASGPAPVRRAGASRHDRR